MPNPVKKTFYIPQAYSISSFVDSDGKQMDFGDEGASVDLSLEKLDVEITLLRLLSRLSDRQKIILMFLILRESGYDMTHEECAKTISVTREHYMVLLKEVRSKVSKLLHENAV